MAEIRSRVLRSDAISAADYASIVGLFESSYREANLAYLAKSCDVFRFVALAEADGETVGFVFGDSHRVALPRLEGEYGVALAGIGCVAESARRGGLFGRLSMEAMLAGEGLEPGGRFLFAGRMAHVVTYRTMAHLSPSVVPAPGKPISAWHAEVAVRVAKLLNSTVDENTLIVAGGGEAVGFPRLEYDQSDGERALFAGVDRNRGDTLLAMCWLPEAPEGW